MAQPKAHLDDIVEIRKIMERSTRFLSLSGWSGIFAGLFALLGTILAWWFLDGGTHFYDEKFRALSSGRPISIRLFLILDASAVLMLALGFSLYFSWRKTKNQGMKLWTSVTRQLLLTMLVPLIAGGILSIILILKNHINLIAPITLIFYGLALVNAGRFTNREAVMLGMAEIVIGMAAAAWQDYGFWFWGIGFGIMHILYGVILFFKYDRSSE